MTGNALSELTISENEIATLEANDGNGELQMLKDPMGLGPSPGSARVEIGDETVRVQIGHEHPHANGFDVEFDIETRTVNEFAHFQSYKNSEAMSTYERYNATKVMVLFRTNDKWFYGEPKIDPGIQQKARYPQSDHDPDSHFKTQHDGITRKNVSSHGRSGDTFSKDRYKVTKHFVERVDEVYVLKWDEKHEAGRNGSYTKQSNEIAYKLVVEE